MFFTIAATGTVNLAAQFCQCTRVALLKWPMVRGGISVSRAVIGGSGPNGKPSRREAGTKTARPARFAVRASRDKLVGARRFELLTPCAQGRCATRLRYAPTLLLH
jgi:hypothetical protein